MTEFRQGQRVRLLPASDFFAQARGTDGTVNYDSQSGDGWISVTWDCGKSERYPNKDIIPVDKNSKPIKQTNGRYIIVKDSCNNVISPQIIPILEQALDYQTNDSVTVYELTPVAQIKMERRVFNLLKKRTVKKFKK